LTRHGLNGTKAVKRAASWVSKLTPEGRSPEFEVGESFNDNIYKMANSRRMKGTGPGERHSRNREEGLEKKNRHLGVESRLVHIGRCCIPKGTWRTKLNREGRREGDNEGRGTNLFVEVKKRSLLQKEQLGPTKVLPEGLGKTLETIGLYSRGSGKGSRSPLWELGILD